VRITTANRVEWLQRRHTKELIRAAKSFLRTGLDLAQATSTDAGAKQAAVANLAVSVELMLKARLAALSLGLLYVDLPVELRVILSDPSAVPDSYNVHRWLNFIEIGQYKTQRVDYCISAWSVYGADTAPPKPYLTRVSELRDRSVHGVLPALDHYEVARVAYTALMMYSDTLRLRDGLLPKGLPHRCGYQARRRLPAGAAGEAAQEDQSGEEAGRGTQRTGQD
jgi:hypothetical protein